MSTNAHLVTATGATIFTGGKTYQVPLDHANYSKILDAIRADQWHLVEDLADLRAGLVKWMTQNFSGNFKLVGDRLSYRDYTFGFAVTNKALTMIERGMDAKPLLRFLANVILNPSHSAREELLMFCEANGFMISSNGMIVAYKSVRGDYFDKHSGKHRYMVGDVVTMERGECDDRRDVTCSTGLHFAAYNYAANFGGGDDRLMVIEVNPRDVVAIPADYHNEKGRACQITSVAEIDRGTPLPTDEVHDFSDAPLSDEYNDFDEYDGCDDCDCDNDGFWAEDSDPYDEQDDEKAEEETYFNTLTSGQQLHYTTGVLDARGHYKEFASGSEAYHRGYSAYGLNIVPDEVDHKR